MEYSLNIPNGGPLAESENVAWRDVGYTPLCLTSAETQIRRIIFRAFATVGVTPNVQIEPRAAPSLIDRYVRSHNRKNSLDIDRATTLVGAIRTPHAPNLSVASQEETGDHMRISRWLTTFAVLAGFLAPAIGDTGAARTEDKFITLASTTSTEASGLFGHLLPMFKAESGIAVRVVAVGTGQALRLAANGDADVLFVHHKPSEEKFVAEGWGVERFDVMYNDFVLVGPKADPARVSGRSDAAAALKAIADAKAVFASRGDDSGTHKKERGLWRTAGVEIDAASGSWYRETGSGMGATLNTANGMQAYALTDRGTWISFQNKGDLKIVLEGDDRLFNQYGVILVNPEKHPHVKAALGQQFIAWVTSPKGQQAIADYKLGGQQLFFPNASGF